MTFLKCSLLNTTHVFIDKLFKLVQKRISLFWLLPTIIVFGLVVACIFILGWLSKPIPSNTPFSEITNAVYQDPTASIEARVEDLLGRMTTAEKIGQLILVAKSSVRDQGDIVGYGIGAILSGGGDKPEPNTPQGWFAMVNQFQIASKKSRLRIPVLYGVDAVHGHTNVPGATIFPHAIGLGAAHDEDLVRRIGVITAQELAATGIHWNFSPTLDVVQDVRWGRTYETFGSETDVVRKLGVAYIQGLQMTTSNHAPVIGTAKHYLGTGAMIWGTSGNPDFKIDQGVTRVDEETLRKTHLPPFVDAIKEGIGSIMVGHTSWNGAELAASHYLLTDVLKKELGFEGFVVSDWYGVYEIPGGQYNGVVTAINAGVDMVMLPYDYISFTNYMQLALARGDITHERLDDAVRRILGAKFKAGLFDTDFPNDSDLDQIGSKEHREVAREAVRKSLVLLKDDQSLLPLSKEVSHILVAGSSAHNLGRQSGGWTIEWQGIDGNWITGITILDAIKDSVSKNTVVDYSIDGTFSKTETLADVGIAIVGEAPYAEGWGDNAHPALSPEDLKTIANVKRASEKLVVVIVSGRPLDIRPYANAWGAIVAAWLPGSEGMGVTDVLFGDEPFTGSLPIAWPMK